MLPFLLFSATAGRLADWMDKARLICRIKVAEIVCMLIGGAALTYGHPAAILTAVVLVATQTAFFGPLRYGILPDLLDHDSLLAANGWIEAGQVTAILAGSMGGTLLAAKTPAVLGMLLVTVAICGWGFASAVPSLPVRTTGSRLGANILAHSWDAVRPAWVCRRMRRLMGAIAWGWLAGVVVVTQLPGFAKTVLQVDETLVAANLAAYAGGISVGALLCGRLLRSKPSDRLLPLGCLVMAAAAFLLASCSASTAAWIVAAGFAAFGLGSAVSIVPLYALLQREAAADMRCRIMAVSNIAVSLFVVIGSSAVSVLLASGLGVGDIFAIDGGINVLVAVAACRGSRR
jgi:hypothetical protein